LLLVRVMYLPAMELVLLFRHATTSVLTVLIVRGHWILAYPQESAILTNCILAPSYIVPIHCIQMDTFNLVLGVVPHNRLSCWGGLGLGPYDNVIGIGKLSLEINRQLALNTSVGFGKAEGVNQNAFSLGLVLKIPK